MPQAFTSQQMETIRQKLFQCACRHAVDTGMKKTSLETLTADAGISKSTFYKFFDSKEVLFLQVARHFERMMLDELENVLHQTNGVSSKARTAAAVNAAFSKFAALGAMRFFREDMPEIVRVLAPQLDSGHLLDMTSRLMECLMRENIRFREPPEKVAAVIQLLFMSVQHMSDMENFTEAMQVLVLGACEMLVE